MMYGVTGSLDITKNFELNAPDADIFFCGWKLKVLVSVKDHQMQLIL